MLILSLGVVGRELLRKVKVPKKQLGLKAYIPFEQRAVKLGRHEKTQENGFRLLGVAYIHDTLIVLHLFKTRGPAHDTPVNILKL